MAEIKVYTVDEVAAVLRVTRRSVYNYISANQIKAFKIGRDWRVTEDALRSFMEHGTQDGYMQMIGTRKRVTA